MKKNLFYVNFIKQFLLYCFICVLLIACAQVVSPGGGPKDNIPPRVVKYSPDSAALQFKGNSFNITFNEFIQLKDLNGQLIVSPLLKKIPDVKIKNKTMIVSFDDTLKENTTYTFNFGNSIRDITEDNYIDGFRYIFSTGDFLDSLSLVGKADFAFDHKTEKGILVMLYDELYDSLPYKKLPTYFAKTKDDGTFTINNIKTGKYKVVALKDINSNYMYDEGEESVGFLNEPIDLKKDDTISLSLFQEIPKKLFLKRSRVEGYGHLSFVFNKPVEKINVQPLYARFKKEWYIEEYNPKHDTLNIWLTEAGSFDSISIVLSEKNKVIDTLFFNLIRKETAFNPKGGRGEKIALRATVNAKNGQPFDLNKSIEIEFNHPIKQQDKDRVIIKKDSVALSPSIYGIDFLSTVPPDNSYRAFTLFKSGVDTTNQKPNRLDPGYITQVYIKDPKAKYSIFIPPNSFTDIFGLTNDTIKVDFVTREEKYYGTLKLKLNLPTFKEEMIIQLLGEKEEIIKQDYIYSSKDSIFNYSYLSPHKYKFKIVYDTNKNGKWDAGDYLKHQQAEKVIYCKEEIDIRSNWDKEIVWKLTE